MNDRLGDIDSEEYIPSVLYVPNVVDIELTGDCDYSCPGCWGSKPTESELSRTQWLEVFQNLDTLPDDHVSRVIITGGEALIRKDVGKLACSLVDIGKEVSLSTTGMDYHSQLEELVKILSTIGLPIDGPSPEIHSLWRKHPKLCDGGLSISLDALRLIQKINPNLQTSVRTLVHRGNVDEVNGIPEFLEKSGIDTERLRWILYELNTRKNSEYQFEKRLVSSGAISSSSIGPEGFQSSIETSGSRFKEVVIRTVGNIAGRNFIISPTGECRAVIQSDTENEVIEKDFGNIHEDFDGVIASLNEDVETMGTFSISAANGPGYYYFMQDQGVDIDDYQR